MPPRWHTDPTSTVRRPGPANRSPGDSKTTRQSSTRRSATSGSTVSLCSPRTKPNAHRPHHNGSQSHCSCSASLGSIAFRDPPASASAAATPEDGTLLSSSAGGITGSSQSRALIVIQGDSSSNEYRRRIPAVTRPHSLAATRSWCARNAASLSNRSSTCQTRALSVR